MDSLPTYEIESYLDVSSEPQISQPMSTHESNWLDHHIEAMPMNPSSPSLPMTSFHLPFNEFDFIDQVLPPATSMDTLIRPNTSCSTKPAIQSTTTQYTTINTTSKPKVLTTKQANYEMKKSRAKISRKELNIKFAELMQVLAIPFHTKANRATIVDAAIVRIKELQNKLDKAEAEIIRLSSASSIASGRGHLKENCSTYQPPCSGHSHLYPPLVNNVPVMWVPLGSCLQMHKSDDSSKRKAQRRITSRNKPTRKRIASTNSQPRLCMNDVVEVSNLVSFLDAMSLSKAAQVSKLWSKRCSDTDLWSRLCRKRWNLRKYDVNKSNTRLMWQQMHQNMIMPRNKFVECQNYVAMGRYNGIDAWIDIGRRSNCRTNRTIRVGRCVKSMEVVELRLVLQNYFWNDVSIDFSNLQIFDKQYRPFQLAGKDNGANVEPRLVEVDGNPDVNMSVPSSFRLGSFQYVVAIFYVLCPNQPFETDFLRAAGSLQLPISYMGTGERKKQNVAIVADFEDEAAMWQRYQVDSSGVVLPKSSSMDKETSNSES